MNGFRGGDDLRLVNDRIHALHVDAERQRLLRRADLPGSPETAHRSVAALVGWPRRVLHGRAATVGR